MRTLRLLAFLLFALPLFAQVPPPPAATQAEVDAGLIKNKYVSPSTFSNSTGATGAVGPNGSVGLYFTNYIFVDATRGSDVTGQRGDAAKPFATLGSAQIVALSGDILYAKKGDYSSTRATNVMCDYYLEENAIIQPWFIGGSNVNIGGFGIVTNVTLENGITLTADVLRWVGRTGINTNNLNSGASISIFTRAQYVEVDDRNYITGQMFANNSTNLFVWTIFASKQIAAINWGRNAGQSRFYFDAPLYTGGNDTFGPGGGSIIRGSEWTNSLGAAEIDPFPRDSLVTFDIQRVTGAATAFFGGIIVNGTTFDVLPAAGGLPTTGGTNALWGFYRVGITNANGMATNEFYYRGVIATSGSSGVTNNQQLSGVIGNHGVITNETQVMLTGNQIQGTNQYWSLTTTSATISMASSNLNEGTVYYWVVTNSVATVIVNATNIDYIMGWRAIPANSVTEITLKKSFGKTTMFINSGISTYPIPVTGTNVVLDGSYAPNFTLQLTNAAVGPICNVLITNLSTGCSLHVSQSTTGNGTLSFINNAFTVRTNSPGLILTTNASATDVISFLISTNSTTASSTIVKGMQ